jgi:hypothetical protein
MLIGLCQVGEKVFIKIDNGLLKSRLYLLGKNLLFAAFLRRAKNICKLRRKMRKNSRLILPKVNSDTWEQK